MLHLAAYTVLLGTTANTDVPALADDYLTIVNSHFQLRKAMGLLGAWVGSATLNRARIDSPSVRLLGNPFIRPIQQAALPASNPPFFDLISTPYRLKAYEEIAIQATSDIAMGTERFTALLWLADLIKPVPQGNIHALRFTSTTAAVANTWTTLTITLDSALPPGEYALVNSELQSTNGIAHRWIFPDQLGRPGAISATGLGNRQNSDFYRFRLGEWGRFMNTSLPTLQALANGADASHTGWIYVVQTQRLTPVE